MNLSYNPLNQKKIFSSLNRRKNRPSFILVLFLAVLLLASTIAVSYLYIKDHQKHAFLVWQLQETQKTLQHIHLSLARGDLKRAFADLDQAQKSVAEMLPKEKVAPPKSMMAKKEAPASVAPPTSTVPTAPPVVPATAAAPAPQAVPPVATVPAAAFRAAAPAALVIPEGKSPYPFILAVTGEYLLVCEKDKKTLHLFRYGNKGFTLVKSYACIVGANGLDKHKEGDLATPVGNYFTLRFIPKQALSEKYGFGAFVLNYPNFLDRKARKDGAGIWLHGHAPGINLGAQELRNTSGCIVVGNEDLKELKGYIKDSGTPVVVVNSLQYVPRAQQEQRAAEITDLMKSWGKAWESGKSDLFMGHYSVNFINADGMNYQAFKRQKETVNKGKKFIQVRIEDMACLLAQEKEGQIAVVRFMQRYRSNNFKSDSRKIFYLRKGPPGWQIIGESRL